MLRADRQTVRGVRNDAWGYHLFRHARKRRTGGQRRCDGCAHRWFARHSRQRRVVFRHSSPEANMRTTTLRHVLATALLTSLVMATTPVVTAADLKIAVAADIR